MRHVTSQLVKHIPEKDRNNREVRELAATHLGEIRAKIADLTAMERALADAVRRCDAGEAPGCPVLDALSEA